FRFLCSPTEIIHNSDGRVAALRIEDMELVPKGDDFSARGLGTFTDIEADTIIFAVGDSTDPDFGLPNGKAGYATRPDPDPERPGDEAYQVFDPQTGEVVTGAFVIGWSRLASDGLVGKARQDGQRGVRTVNYADVQRLERIEQQEAQQRGLEYFRFASNEEMFTHLNDG